MDLQNATLLTIGLMIMFAIIVAFVATKNEGKQHKQNDRNVE